MLQQPQVLRLNPLGSVGYNMEWLVPVVVAVIGGPLMWGLHRFDKRNTEQHGQNLEVLNYIREDVKEVRQDVKDVRKELNDHINSRVEL